MIESMVGFYESIYNCIVETWDWIVEQLRPFSWAIAVFNLVGALLLLVALLRSCFQ